MADAAQSYTQVLATFDLTGASGDGSKFVTQTIGSDEIVLTAQDANWIVGNELDITGEYTDLDGTIAGVSDESKVTITVAGGKTFDFSSIGIVDYSDTRQTLVITSDKGDVSYSVIKSNTDQSWAVSVTDADAQGVSRIELTTSYNSAFDWVFDNIVLNNIAAPNISIDDVSITEGNSGTTTMAFTVSLSSPAPVGGVTFDIATADNTATAGSDYVVKSLTSQTIPEGSSTYTFDVTINGDTVIEGNETFFVNLTNVIGATVSDGQGQGTITNDDVNTTPFSRDITSFLTLGALSGAQTAAGTVATTATDNITLEAWVYLTSTAGAHHALINGNGAQNGYGLYLQGGGKVSVLMGNEGFVQETGTSLQVGQWTHIAATRASGGDGTLGWKIYINGQSVSTEQAYITGDGAPNALGANSYVQIGNASAD
ncbi:MAG: hypothetical protein EOM08_14145, partial [Clostridia bacterium]|nr:hypothetical protein [Clostridia bacterium]